eukprot:TRINITY_DN13136_c0_g4_i1.p1 TRINITY_DN13136_c0_g4~~TRINITY_DN13136_c0_g4_i1.p1  ORF type:complete len:193 (+),score=50.83 TRINITY_DN13136_c0_g4_i1:85-663(+)
MLSGIFSAEQVMYGAASFNNVRIGYNRAAGCLNLFVPGSTRGGVEIVSKVKDAKVSVDGKVCSVGAAVKASFCDEVAAAKFAAALGFAPKITKAEEVAPCTPPRRKRNTVEMTPQPQKRARSDPTPCVDEKIAVAPITPPCRTTTLGTMTPPRKFRARAGIVGIQEKAQKVQDYQKDRSQALKIDMQDALVH